MKLIVQYNAGGDNKCIAAYIVPNTVVAGAVIPIELDTTALVVAITITAGTIQTHDGAVAVSEFIQYVTCYQYTSGTGIKRLAGTNVIDKRKIDPGDYNSTIPLSFSRANTTVNFGVL